MEEYVSPHIENIEQGLSKLINMLENKEDGSSSQNGQSMTPSTTNIEAMQDQIKFLMQNMQLLQKMLDNERKANIEFKKQLNTLQGKGANMAENNEPIQTQQAVQQWEYKRVSPSSLSDEKLDELGQASWELVATTNSSVGATNYIFKRPKPAKNKPAPDCGYGR